MTSSTHLVVDIDEGQRLVRATRSRDTLDGEGDIVTMVALARHALGGLDRARYAMLIDLRKSSFVDESRYETAMVALRRELTRGFRKTAMLVETSTGKLQVNRFIRDERLAASAFDDEAKALAFLFK